MSANRARRPIPPSPRPAQLRLITRDGIVDEEGERRAEERFRALDERTRVVGLAGVAAAREALHAHDPQDAHAHRRSA